MPIKIELYYWPNANAGFGHTAINLHPFIEYSSQSRCSSPIECSYDSPCPSPNGNYSPLAENILSRSGSPQNEDVINYFSGGRFETLTESCRIYGNQFIIFTFNSIKEFADIEEALKMIKSTTYSLGSNNCAHITVKILNILGLHTFKSGYLLRPIHVAKQAVQYGKEHCYKLLEQKYGIAHLVLQLKAHYYHILQEKINYWSSFEFTSFFVDLATLISSLDNFDFEENIEKTKYFIDLCDRYARKLPLFQNLLIKLKTDAQILFKTEINARPKTYRDITVCDYGSTYNLDEKWGNSMVGGVPLESFEVLYKL